MVSNIGNSGTHYNNSENKLLNNKTYEIDFEKFDINNYKALSKEEEKSFLYQFKNKIYSLSLRDRFYLFRKKWKLV